jgi:hypothetical protein
MRGFIILMSGGALSLVSLGALAAPPDLSGVWFISSHVGAAKTVEGKTPPLNAAAKVVYDAHRAAAAKGDFSYDGMTHCLPPGLPRLMLVHEPFEILQKPKVIYFVHQLNRLPRRAYLDALVIDTNGFDDSTMLDNVGLPHSDAMHLTERYELSADGMRLHLRYTIDDPKTFTQTWSGQADYVKRPGYELTEQVCAATPPAKRPRS